MDKPTKSTKPTSRTKAEWNTLAARVAWVVEVRFGGNRSAMAKAIGFSHTMIASVMKKERTPGRRLEDAIVNRLGVSREWLKDGTGQPFPSADNRPARGIAVSHVPLPGLPHEHQDLVTRWIAVPEVVPSGSQYWLVLKSTQPILRRPSPAFRVGDHLLMETNPARFPRESALNEVLCVVRGGADGAVLRLATVDFWPASVDTGDARLEADFHEPAKRATEVVEKVYRHYPDGEVVHLERRMKQREMSGVQPMLPVVQYTDIVSVWLRILRRPFA